MTTLTSLFCYFLLFRSPDSAIVNSWPCNFNSIIVNLVKMSNKNRYYNAGAVEYRLIIDTVRIISTLLIKIKTKVERNFIQNNQYFFMVSTNF